MATAAVLQFPTPTETPAKTITHESFVHAVREIVVERVPEARERLLSAKLVYGAGPGGYRGVCFFGAWKKDEQTTQEFIEIAATGEESPVQLAGTTVHELAHALAGHTAGHGREWKDAAAALGLTIRAAGGQDYKAEDFDPEVWKKIEALGTPNDGTPTFANALGVPVRLRRTPKPCSAGIGTRGGRSRGPGSGSRLRLWVCGCPEGTVGRKVRVASDEWDATCNRCHETYRRDEPGAATVHPITPKWKESR